MKSTILQSVNFSIMSILFVMGWVVCLPPLEKRLFYLQTQVLLNTSEGKRINSTGTSSYGWPFVTGTYLLARLKIFKNSHAFTKLLDEQI